MLVFITLMRVVVGLPVCCCCDDWFRYSCVSCVFMLMCVCYALAWAVGLGFFFAVGFFDAVIVVLFIVCLLPLLLCYLWFAV